MNYSNQREKIIYYIQNAKTHPSAKEIYNDLKKDNPKLSLGTVYRNLKLLYEEGIISKVINKFSEERYEAKNEKHYHIECIKCGNIKDILVKMKEDLYSDIEEQYKCDVFSDDLIFQTLCNKCRQSKECKDCNKKKYSNCKKCKWGGILNYDKN